MEKTREREREREREKKGRDTGAVLGSREMLVGHLRNILACFEFITELKKIHRNSVINSQHAKIFHVDVLPSSPFFLS